MLFKNSSKKKSNFFGFLKTTTSSAINGASSGNVNKTMSESAGDAATGNSFIELNNEHLTNAVSALGDETRITNQVIDTNSMMTAFQDYVNKCIEGNCGVPINFFLKELTKPQIAKIYIRKFYPNGATNRKDAMKGQLGQEPGATS